MDPFVGVIYRRDKHPGANRLSDLLSPDSLSAVACDLHLPLSEALTREWDEDAHLILYRLDADRSGEEWTFARANKRSPFLVELMRAGGGISVPLVVFDFDLPGKAEWTADSLDIFMAALGELPLPAPTYWYTTLHGCRFVYVLSRRVDTQEAEGVCRAIYKLFLDAGVELDPSCRDWTRVFRLPKTVRQDTGQPFHTSPLFRLLEDPTATFDPDSVSFERLDADVFAVAEPYTGDRPTPDECLDMVRTMSANGRVVMTSWCKLARKFLQGRESFEVCFNHALFNVEKYGGRNQAITKIAGQIIGMTASQEGASPEGVYALLFDAVEQLQADDRSEDWHATAWDIVCRLWSNEWAQIAARRQEQQRKALEADSAREALLEQTRQADPTVPDEPEQAREWFARRMIASDGRRHYVMDRNGHYSLHAVGDSMLVPMIRELGMDEIIPTMEMVGKSYKPKSAQSILNDSATPVRSVRCSARDTHSYIAGEEGYRELRVPIHRLNPRVVPHFFSTVDKWMRELFGDRYEVGIEWLSHSLQVNAAICALNLYGTAGAGKGMLVQGLVECFEGETINDGRALDRWNLGLLDSPILVCDEGVPSIKSLGNSVDQVFRSLVTGGTVSVEGKMRDIITAQIYPRVLFTSNNSNMLQVLLGKGDLNAKDVEAIETRMLTIHIPPSAKTYLCRAGNYRHTEGWVHGQKESSYILASHIRWLYENRTPSIRSSGRLLVEGDLNTDLMRDTMMKGIAQQRVLRALIKMVEKGACAGLQIQQGKAWVTPYGLLLYMENNDSAREAISLSRVHAMLQQFQSPNPTPPPVKVGHESFVELDLLLLHEEATRYGLPRNKIHALLEEAAA